MTAQSTARVVQPTPGRTVVWDDQRPVPVCVIGGQR